MSLAFIANGALIRARYVTGRAWLALLWKAGGLVLLLPLNLLAQPCALDPSFNPVLNAGAAVYVLTLQTNGDILIGGAFRSVGDVNITNIARLHPDGAFDPTFQPGAAANVGYVSAIAVQSDEKILIGGAFYSSASIATDNLTRLNPDGTVDYSFDSSFYVDGPVNTVAALDDGTILVGGGFNIVTGVLRRNIARLNFDGSLDAVFDACVASGAGYGASSLAVLPNGKILVSGNFSFSTGFLRIGIARLHVDGDIDSAFAVAQPGIGPTGSIPYALALRGDGRVLLGGNFRTYLTTSRPGLVQLTTSGTIDSSFNPGTGVNEGGTVYCMSIQSDGKILLGGDFSSYREQPIHGVARVDASGSLDTACDPGLGPNNAVSSFAIQRDGQILVAGKFTTFNGESRNGLARLNGDHPPFRLGVPTWSETGELGMRFSGQPQTPYLLQASSNLVDWISVTNFTSTNTSMLLLESSPTPGPVRFYRVMSNR